MAHWLLSASRGTRPTSERTPSNAANFRTLHSVSQADPQTGHVGGSVPEKDKLTNVTGAHAPMRFLPRGGLPGGRSAALLLAHHLHEAPRRHERPAELQQEESVLPLVSGQDVRIVEPARFKSR